MAHKALLTGGSRGIGKAISKLFRDSGIEVIAPTRQEMDLLSDTSVDKFISNLNGDVDILINDAGINPLGELVALNDNNIEEVIKVNLISPIRLMRAIAPKMIKKKWGRILNISSVWSTVSKPGRLVYASSKAGLDAATRTAALELAPHNILVNSIAPGFINTELTKQNMPPKELEAVRNTVPLKRLAEPKEIAELALFLCSEKNTFVTGQVILADGGYTCQ